MLALVKIPKIGHVPKYKIWHVELNATISRGVEEIPNSRAYCCGDKNLRIENTTPFFGEHLNRLLTAKFILPAKYENANGN